MFSLEKAVAKVRFHYHANRIDINNTLNQLHLMSDERNEESNRKHCMILMTDVFPRLGLDISKLFNEKDNQV